MIRSAIADPSFGFLAASDLADAVELVKFTPSALDLEALSKLWSVFFQTPHALSVAYEGTVVLVESDETTAEAAPPVRTRIVLVTPFRQPVIERLVSRTGPGQPILEEGPILAGHTLVIAGRHLRGDAVPRIRIDGIEVSPDPDAASDTHIAVPLPAGLRAGLHGVQVVQPALMGAPPTPHAGIESNVSAFVLQPTITVTASPVSTRTVDGVTLSTADVTVSCGPPVGKAQRVVLLLNEFNPPAGRSPRAHGVPAPSRQLPSEPEETASLTIRIVDVVAGTYLVRLQVDGAESPLAIDASGQYAAPQITI
jgi:hypothetical protein